jgi:hypothetical protein
VVTAAHLYHAEAKVQVTSCPVSPTIGGRLGDIAAVTLSAL